MTSNWHFFECDLFGYLFAIRISLILVSNFLRKKSPAMLLRLPLLFLISG